MTTVEECLERIAEREEAVHAWAFLDPDDALDQARRREMSTSRGPLHGVPVGVKDIFDTADMPTEYGSAIYRGNRPDRDAAVVARLRTAGAVILGKTATTEFAALRRPRRGTHALSRIPRVVHQVDPPRRWPTGWSRLRLERRPLARR